MQTKSFKRSNIGIPEERQFTNPHVRFIRKHGRVIPIFNKKRIGQDTSKYGEKLLGAGLVVSASGLIKHKAGKKIASTKVAKLFAKDAAKLKKSILKSRFASKQFAGKYKKLNFISKVSGGAIRKSIKHMGKFGLAATALGIGATVLGSELQMRSPFGKDLFFVRDQHDRSS